MTRLFGIATMALVGCALAPSLVVFALASVAVGIASVAGQVMIPFAADLAPEERRGRVVARIMTGLLLGILLARTVSGLVAQAAGWRAIYWLSAALMVLFAALLWRALPDEGPRPHRATPTWWPPRFGCWSPSPCCGAGPGTAPAPSPPSASCGPPWPSCSRAAPTATPMPSSGSSAWLVRPGSPPPTWPANWPIRPRTRATTVVAGVLLAGSFALLWSGRTSLAALVVGIVVLDIGTQGMQITNQAVIYALRPDARSRINSAYMVCYFLGGAVGSVAAGAALRHARLGRRLPARRRLRPAHPRHVGLRSSAAAGPCSGFDDLQPVAVLITEAEHRRRGNPPCARHLDLLPDDGLSCTGSIRAWSAPHPSRAMS